ncbi:hypothetical protein RRG08_011631 [Elysia crispata]|uniref:Uncharacterized protein n=1 Tax=Elysia crispata TaxID=231223 RepID=A0AAE0YVR8_9GAST|nr:hypothetical protein RRG08_011631 [Elysia crispata]
METSSQSVHGKVLTFFCLVCIPNCSGSGIESGLLSLYSSHDLPRDSTLKYWADHIGLGNADRKSGRGLSSSTSDCSGQLDCPNHRSVWLDYFPPRRGVRVGARSSP